MALNVDATASGPPGELGVLPRTQICMRFAVPLDQSLQHHALGWHVDAQSQCFGCEDHLDQPLLEQVLDDFLECREHAGMVGRDSPLKGFCPIDVVESCEIVVRDTHCPFGDG